MGKKSMGSRIKYSIVLPLLIIIVVVFSGAPSLLAPARAQSLNQQVPGEVKPAIFLPVVGAALAVLGIDVANYLLGGECGKWNLLSYFSVTCLIAFLGQAVAFIAGFFIMLTMLILEFALRFNSKIYDLPAVQIGWTFTRDIANMGFVLGIIVIAFATILRSQTYGVKQLIVRLIIAAIAVNLSLNVAGFFLDMAGIPTQFFIDKISESSGGPFAFTDTLASAFSIQNLSEFNKKVGADRISYGARGMTVLASVFFTLIFSFIILVTLIALTVMFLARFLTLAILIILVPMAILFWVFPDLRRWWGQWSEAFIRWTFFAPAALFFLYLAIYTIRVQGAYIEAIAGGSSINPIGLARSLNNTIITGTSDPVLLIANMIVMVLLTLGGLYAANKLGIYGAQAAYSMAVSGSKRILRAGTLTPAAAIGRRAMTLGGGTGPEGKPKPTYAQRVATRLASLPIAGRFFAGAAEKIGETVREVQKGVEKERKSFADQDKAYRSATLSRMTSVAEPVRASALILEMAKRGELRDLDEKGKSRLENLLTKLSETNNTKEFLHYMPEYAERFGQKIKDVIPAAPPEAYQEMKPEVFNSEKNPSAEEAVLYSSSAGLRRIAERGDPATIYEIMRTFDKITEKYKKFDADAERRVIEAGSAADAGDDAKEAAKEARERLQTYQRYQGQRNFFYQDPIYQGFADPEDLESFREERRARRRGKTTRSKTS